MYLFFGGIKLATTPGPMPLLTRWLLSFPCRDNCSMYLAKTKWRQIGQPLPDDQEFQLLQLFFPFLATKSQQTMKVCFVTSPREKGLSHRPFVVVERATPYIALTLAHTISMTRRREHDSAISKMSPPIVEAGCLRISKSFWENELLEKVVAAAMSTSGISRRLDEGDSGVGSPT